MSRIKTLLVIVLILGNYYANSQDFKILLDSNYRTTEIVATDTIIWQFYDSINMQQRYPMNCNISFNNDIILHTCTLKKRDNSYGLTFSKSSYGLKIDVIFDIDFNKNKCTGRIRYYESVEAVERYFKILSCRLTLNKNNLVSFGVLQGHVNLSFKGVDHELVTFNEIKYKGHVDGDFFVRIH